ncbi:MAG: hypothetical protein ACKVOF_04970 [Pseudohongiellaceae bacterium]
MPLHDEDYEQPAPYALRARQPVELQIHSETELGFKAVIDDRYIGLIYKDEISQPLKIGEYLKGWIKALRPDGKIDLSITMLDAESRDELQEIIMRYLASKGGRANLSDKSAPEEIFYLFKTSKKNFKRAIGSLYKDRKIKIADDHIELV